MKKKILCLALVILTALSALPISIFAAGGTVTSCIDLPTYDNDKIGSGYEWDNLTRVLILTDLKLSTADAFGIKLPENATVILNGNNTISAASYGIQCLGALTIKGAGTLTVTAAMNGISAVSSQEKHTLTFLDGTVTVNGAKNGIYAENSEIVFSGSSIKVDATENSVFGKNIKMVSGSLELAGKIKAKGALTVSNVALTVSSADKAIEAAQGISLMDVSVSVGESLSSLAAADGYNGEKAIKTVGTRDNGKKGFLFGGALPAFVDYIVIALIVLAVAAVIVLPIIIKRKKTAALVAASTAQKTKKKKK